MITGNCFADAARCTTYQRRTCSRRCVWHSTMRWYELPATSRETTSQALPTSSHFFQMFVPATSCVVAIANSLLQHFPVLSFTNDIRRTKRATSTVGILKNSERARLVFIHMREYLDSRRDRGVVPVDDYKRQFESVERVYANPFPVNSSWQHCKGTTPMFRWAKLLNVSWKLYKERKHGIGMSKCPPLRSRWKRAQRSISDSLDSENLK
ncbi:hypothetical protein OESDEN_00733 [Oesophagostomum dentatum]|uniref:Uncharacterized protein n=1 Tax=Oesophagostomum dentatum TaxID=61180 RepID=A0A0B1TPU0_OESDE|nr:hypothetical protein OESDEN_00733 [Oesophagostomum dentatum]